MVDMILSVYSVLMYHRDGVRICVKHLYFTMLKQTKISNILLQMYSIPKYISKRSENI